MNPGLLALAIGLVAAGVLCVATRDTRSAVVAAAVVAVVSPVAAGGSPEPLPLAARLLAGILASYLLWAAVRGQPATAGSPLGIPAEVLLAGAAFGAGYAAVGGTGIAGPGRSPEVVAGGAALLALSAAPLFASRDALRTTIGALLALQGAWLVRAGVVGPAAAVEELAVAGLTVALGAAGAALIGRVRGGSGTLDLGARRTLGGRGRSGVDDGDDGAGPEPPRGGGRRRRRAPPA